MKLVKDTEFLVIDFETITPKGRSPEPIEVGVLRIKENKYLREVNSWGEIYRYVYNVKI